MSVLYTENRFGGKAIASEDPGTPSPMSYAIPDDWQQCTNGTYGPRPESVPNGERNMKKEIDRLWKSREGPEEVCTDGEFAKVYTKRDIQRYKKKHQMARDMKPMEQPAIHADVGYRRDVLKVDVGPGDYQEHSKLTVQNVSRDIRFGTDKRLTMEEHLHRTGKLGCGPSPSKYTLHRNDIASTIHQKHDMKTILARMQHNEDVLTCAFKSHEMSKSAKEFKKHFHKLRNSYLRPENAKTIDRFQTLTVDYVPGPGQYKQSTDFSQPIRTSKSSTFGVSARKDIVESLQAIGQAPNFYVPDPGSYQNLNKKTCTSHNSRTKPVVRRQPHTKRCQSAKYEIRPNSKIFNNKDASKLVGPDALFKALMKPRDLSKFITP